MPYICFKPFKGIGSPKVRDHCHYSGIYSGAAHSLCNLQYKIPSYIPVVFHNLSGYDAHMFIKELASSSPDEAKMGIIAKNKEAYITFLISVEVDKYINKNEEEKSKEIDLRFIDSFKFMSSSLDSLVNNLARGNNESLDLRIIMSPNISYSFEKEFTHMNIWMIGIDLKKLPSLLRKHSIVDSACLELGTKIMNTLSEFGESLGLAIWGSIMTYIYALMLSCWQMFSKPLGSLFR